MITQMKEAAEVFFVVIVLGCFWIKLEKRLSIKIFTITAEIHAFSLVNFYCQYAERHMNLKFM